MVHHVLSPISRLIILFVDEQVQCELAEANNVKQRPPHPGREDVSLLAKDGAQARARPFEETPISRYAKGHLSGLGCHSDGWLSNPTEKIEEVG